jgi:CheY-like chemotaxis protein
VSAKHDGSVLEIRVRDSGVGIAPDFLPHVFERFRQADSSTKRNQGGLGLGLAIVSHLVQIHGGTVTVESQGPGQGSTFRVQLPIAARETGANGPKPARDGSWANDGGPERQRIDDVRVLVVDDDADARDVMQRLLGMHGAEVTTAASAQEALDLIGSFQPNILISDIGMPQEDGYDLICRLRSLPPELGGRLPALALTAFARPEDGTRAVEAGYQLHLAKPVSPDELVRAVKNALGTQH